MEVWFRQVSLEVWFRQVSLEVWFRQVSLEVWFRQVSLEVWFRQVSLYLLLFVSDSYNITNAKGKVAKFILFKQAYKLGEDIVGVFNFADASVPCVQVSCFIFYHFPIKNHFEHQTHDDKTNETITSVFKVSTYIITSIQSLP